MTFKLTTLWWCLSSHLNQLCTKLRPRISFIPIPIKDRHTHTPTNTNPLTNHVITFSKYNHGNKTLLTDAITGLAAREPPDGFPSTQGYPSLYHNLTNRDYYLACCLMGPQSLGMVFRGLPKFIPQPYLPRLLLGLLPIGAREPPDGLPSAPGLPQFIPLSFLALFLGFIPKTQHIHYHKWN